MSADHDIFDRLKNLISLEKDDIVAVIYFALGIGLMALATPVAVQALVNTIAFGALFQPLVVLTLILLVLVGFSNSLAALQFYVVDMLQRRLFVRIFDATVQRVMNVEHAARDRQHLPELTNRFLDVVTLQKTAAVLLLETLGYVLQTLIGMILLAFYHPLLLAFDLFLIASLAFILFVLGKHGIATGIEQSKAKYAAVAWLENLANNPILTKSSQYYDYLTAQTEQVARDYLSASAKHFTILSRQNAGALLLHTLANTLLLGMGGWMVIERQLSLGQLIAAELVVTAMIYGLTRLGKTLDNFYELLASTDKLGYLLDLPQETEKSIAGTALELVNSNKPCRVKVVNVSLPNNPNLDILRGISLEVQPGERVAITSGADKGSLFELIFGLRLPIGGHISVDDHDLRDVNLRQLRNDIALVNNAEIVSTSITDNVDLGNRLSSVEVRAALAAVGLLDQVNALPDGINTLLIANGRPLTDEQCLRLTLARAIAAKPRLLMIDGLLDRIDQRLAQDVFAQLVAPDKPWTLMIASHVPAMIALCDREIRIENGVALEYPKGKEQP